MPAEFNTFYFPWEMDLLHNLQSIHNPILDKVMSIYTILGDKGIGAIVISLLVLLFVKNKKVGVTMGGALFFSLLFCNILLKTIVMRGRPCWIDTTIPLLTEVPDDYSFPSGHTTAFFAMAVGLVQYYKGWGIVALIAGALMGFSRLYLFVHWPTDVLGGAVVGTIAGLLSGMIVRHFYLKYPNFKIPFLEK